MSTQHTLLTPASASRQLRAGVPGASGASGVLPGPTEMASRGASKARKWSFGWRGNGRSALVFPLIAALVLGSLPASAQTDAERAGARSLAEQGFSAYKSEKWADALDRFERAESLMHAPPHLLYAARASSKLGGYVKARELYTKIVREELGAGAPAAFKQAQKDAAAELPAVEKKIAYLTVTVKGPKPGDARVQLDGVDVPTALVGVEGPVDPGTRVIAVSAPGFTAAEKSVELAAAGHESITVELIADPSAPVVPASPGEGTPVPEQPGSADVGVSTSGSSGMRLGAYISLGLGVVGVGLGALFLVKSGSSQSDSDALFDDAANGCSRQTPLKPAACAESDALNEDAASQGTIGGISLAVGGAALVTGVILFLMSSDSSPKSALLKPHVTPWVGLNSAGLSGRF